MKPPPPSISTGLAGLDQVLHGIEPGDNIVWAVDAIEDYHELVVPYAQAARALGRRLIYFRFGSDPPLIAPEAGVEWHEVAPARGFERFIRQVHKVIEKAGRGAIYIFDSLSHLAEAWCSDQSLGNFFRLTCPRLLDLETVTYFALHRDRHSLYALEPILRTTQFMLDVFRLDGRLYIRPIKVQHRSREAMNTIHLWQGDEFQPVKESAVLAQILSRTQWPRLQSDRRIGYWRRLFREAETLAHEIREGRPPPQSIQTEVVRRVRWALRVHRSGIASLVQEYLTLNDFLNIRDRMIGIGSVGGKTLGMLVARAILRERDPQLAARLEAHDSFFVGAEVFVTFLVENNVWWLREQQKHPELFLQGLEEGRRRILAGQFPDKILEQFAGMLDYFGESPYIVRSSSILEDARGNAFSGKYESVFVVNRGSREERMATLLDAVRRVYASVLDEEALHYRKRRGLLDSEERMALLVMRVSGCPHGRFYFPQAAGVGLSFNPYVWHPDIDPRAGLVRLVFGLGTRAVDRCDDDYTRLVALNAVTRRPEASFEEVCEHTQRRMDCLDLQNGGLVSLPLAEVIAGRPELPLDLYVTRTPEDYPWITFDRLLSETQVAADLRRILALLEEAFEQSVDIEFAINFLGDGSYRIHLLQCRTFQFQREPGITPSQVPGRQKHLLSAHGAVIGVSREQRLSRIIYIVRESYASLPERDRHAVARLIGSLCQKHPAEDRGLMLIGPGRWGTRSPELGIPVSFAEISRASVICEVVAMHERLIPDVSLGTHFFNDLVEHDMLYVAYFPQKTGNQVDAAWFTSTPNRLLDLVPSATALADTVRVIDCASESQPVWLRADTATQEAIVFSIEEDSKPTHG